MPLTDPLLPADPARRRALIATSATGLVVLSGLRPAGAQAQAASPALSGKLLLTGSSSVAPLALEIAKRFETLAPGRRIDVQTGGSSRGVADVRSGAAAIGMVSRALKAEEADLVAHTLARDGIGLIVHASNPVAGLTTAQVRDIYLGRIRDWSEVGGPRRPITVVHKAEGRSTLELFVQHLGLKPSEVKAQVVIGDNAQGLKTVAGNPGAIGYVSIGAAEAEAQAGAPLRLPALDGVAASVAQLRAGRLPIARPLNLVTRGAPGPLAAAFIAYARSTAVADLVAEQFLVPA